MTKTILAAFAALVMAGAMTSAAHAFTRGFPHTVYHDGAYDNTPNSQGGYYSEGGDGGGD
jgi:hypothetical protein